MIVMMLSDQVQCLAKKEIKTKLQDFQGTKVNFSSEHKSSARNAAEKNHERQSQNRRYILAISLQI